jgi:DNA adenine methylase
MAVQLKEERIKPFLRWAGGKTWFIDHLEALLDGQHFANYYEPFLGGGSIFFSLSVTDAAATLSDANTELIDTYISIRDNVEEVIQYFATYENTSDFYYKLREKEPTDPFERAARFIYLNHTSYNGLYRVNRKGKYNVPFGKRKSDTIDIEEIRKASRALVGANLLSGDFENRGDVIHEGTLVFLDPPYTVSHNDNGFVQYNQSIFSIEDQARLARYIQFIMDRGAYFILMNAAHNAIREIFADCGRSMLVERQSLIGGKNAKRGLTSELVFTNIELQE